jgi:hypothetical protein
MNHDLSHCSSEDIIIEHDDKDKPFVKRRVVCPKRDTCHRYKAYLDIPNVKDQTLFSMILAQGCVENNYNLYWEDKE